MTLTIETDPIIEVTEQDITRLLKRPGSMVLWGREKEFEDKLFRTWALGPVIEHRDSTIIAQSNAAALIKQLEARDDLKGKWRIIDMSCSMVGWVKHLSFEVIEPVPELVALRHKIDEVNTVLLEQRYNNEPMTAGEQELSRLVAEVERQSTILGALPGYLCMRVTKMCRVFLHWQLMLESFTVADEDDMNTREYEAALDSIMSEGKMMVDSTALVDHKDWPKQVYEWLYEHHNRALSNEDGTGAFVGTRELWPALYELDLLDLHHTKLFLKMQLDALWVLMEWGAQTEQSMRERVAEMDKVHTPHIDEIGAAMDQLVRNNLARKLESDVSPIYQRLNGWKKGTGTGEVYCRR